LVNLLPEILNLSWGKINAHVRLRSDVPRPERSNAAGHLYSISTIVPLAGRV
jgi:hypothetical protein